MQQDRFSFLRQSRYINNSWVVQIPSNGEWFCVPTGCCLYSGFRWGTYDITRNQILWETYKEKQWVLGQRRRSQRKFTNSASLSSDYWICSLEQIYYYEKHILPPQTETPGLEKSFISVCLPILSERVCRSTFCDIPWWCHKRHWEFTDAFLRLNVKSQFYPLLCCRTFSSLSLQWQTVKTVH